MRAAKRNKAQKSNKFFKGNSQNESPEAEGLDAQKKTRNNGKKSLFPLFLPSR